MKNTRVLLPLFLLFFIPIFGSVALYFWFPEWIPEGKTNYGRLVTPARPVPAFADPLKGRWTYVTLAGTECDSACRDKLVQIRQIRLALNEKRERVQRVLFAADAPAMAEALKAEHPDLRVLPGSEMAHHFFAPTDPQAIYLLDPNGNWLMTYPAAAESRGIYKDIKRLLKLSQIG